MNQILRVARADLRRFFRPSFLLASIGLPGFFGMLVTALVFQTVSGKTTGGPPGAPTITLADVSASNGYLVGVNQAFSFLGVIAVTDRKSVV